MSASTRETVLITGASSQIGPPLRARFAAAGCEVIAVSRRATPGGVQADIAQGAVLPPGHTLIHLAPLKLLPALLPAFFAQGGARVIAFGTTSVHSKAASASPAERAYAAHLLAAEREVARLCEAAGVPWTLFRPTLIYGAGRDRNVALIARLIRRFGVFPLLGEARGLRAPVHVEDLAAACVAVREARATFNKAYDLTGGETLTYRAMVARIFEAMDRRPRFVRVPLALFRLAMWAVSRVPRYRDFNAEMARRMNDDLVFDHTPATRDFGFAPRGFAPEEAP